MTQAAQRLSVINSEPESQAARLHRHVGRRTGLRERFRPHWERIASVCETEELDSWCGVALGLIEINASSACIENFAAFSAAAIARHGTRQGVAAACQGGAAAAQLCRKVGTRPTELALEAGATAVARLVETRDLERWWSGLVLLCERAPESVAVVARNTDTILARCDGETFQSFLHAGLKARGADRMGRTAFFALDDPLARQILDREWSGVSFDRVERGVKAFVAALWGGVPPIHAFEVGALAQPRRSSIAGGVLRVPRVYRSVAPEAVAALYRAVAAHGTAHFEFGAGRFPVGTLKPVQIALVTLIEDARIEALAMRRFPGLRRLWAPYHVASADEGAITAPALLARLARALFDPEHRDGHGLIVKGRALFEAERDNLHDPAVSRRIGGLLGNDLGQMRIQFNPRTYAVEPVYRDDGFGLWDFGDQDGGDPDEIEFFVDAARIEQEERPDEPDRRDDEPDQNEEAEGRAKPVAAEEAGVVVARYPEWDRGAGIERQDWTTVREVAPKLADPSHLEHALDRRADLRALTSRLVRSAVVGRHVRLRRQPDGPEIDLDAAIDHAIRLRSGELPDPRVFRTSAARQRDLAVMVLVDTSESTRDRVEGTGETILDFQRLAVALLAEALDRLGDPLALASFSSEGREQVRLARLKDFNEPYGRDHRARLAGLESGFSTRLGAALRHAGAELSLVRAYRKLLIVLTDGEPSDIDISDPEDLVEDTRRAVAGLRRQGIDTFGVTLDPGGVGSSATIFGRANHLPVHRIEELPQRLADLYFRLARA